MRERGLHAKYLASSPPLSKPTSGEMFLYLGVSESAVSGVLIREEGIQKPVYYVSYSMNGPQTEYQRLKKLVLPLFIISRRLKHYFQTFPITVLTEHPLRSVIENPEATGRILKWASKLRPFGLIFEPRIAIKEQVLADFIADFISGAAE